VDDGNVDLKRGSPKSIIDDLQIICDGEAPVGRPFRWSGLFRDCSYHTPSTHCANFTYDALSKRWSLLGKGDIRNYDNEIEEFFEWIMPYIDAPIGAFIGYKRYEEDLKPNLEYKK